MDKVEVKLGKDYEIWIDKGNLSGIGQELRKFNLSPNTLLISNTTVDELYGETVVRSLESSGFRVTRAVMPDGEEFKTLESAAHLFDCAAEARLERKSAVIALGGGVTGDIGGFVASTYLRGLPFIQVPTTLLAMVDSSIGGKVAVNHSKGKNLIGTFHQPMLVWTDMDTLKTLPQRELLTGMAENIKHGIIADPVLFAYIKDNLQAILAYDADVLGTMVGMSCRVKVAVVEEDEFETGQRAILNFGHTFGHAVENVTQYSRYRHGEAVALGMAAATRLAKRLGMLSVEDHDQILELIESSGLPVSGSGLKAQELFEALAFDKKVEFGAIRFILPVRIGKVEITSAVKSEDVLWAFSTIC